MPKPPTALGPNPLLTRAVAAFTLAVRPAHIMATASHPIDPRLAKLLAGEPVEFPVPPEGKQETLEERAARTIPAKWLENLASEHARVINVPVRIFRAVIAGPLNLEYATFKYGLSLTNCEFSDPVDFSFATFKRAADFNRSRFSQPTDFRAAKAKADFDMIGASFADGSSFMDLHVEEVLDAQGARFGSVEFERIEVSKNAFFRTDKLGNRVMFSGPASFSGAHIHGNAEFDGAEFKDKASFDGLHVDGSAFFRTDKHGNRVTFGGEASFQSAKIKSQAVFRQASFVGPVNFLDAHFGNTVSFEGVVFGKSASFDRFRVDGGAFFRTDKQRNRVTFAAEARFHGAHIQSNAEFDGAEFRGPASFEGLQVDGSAFFRTDEEGNRLTFGGEARFLGAHIKGDADFTGAELKGLASFDGLQVDGSTCFRTDKQGNRVTFGGEAHFIGGHIKGNAEFDGTEFRGQTFFENIQVDRDAYFRPDELGNPVTFAARVGFPSAIFCIDAQFRRAEFRADVSFDNAQFRGAAKFDSVNFSAKAKTTFIGTRFEHGAYFNAAQFLGEADFTAAVAERDAYFSGAQLSGPTSFREARFQGVFFGNPPKPPGATSSAVQTPSAALLDATQSVSTHQQSSPVGKSWWPPWKKRSELSAPTIFGASVDMRGFTYERIYVHLADLFPRLSPVDRQPYTQLEKTFRQVGEDRRADRVYLERRRVEREENWRKKQYGSWLGDAVYRWFAHYGVRPYRLLGLSLLVIAAGAGIFTCPHAVRYKEITLRGTEPAFLSFSQALGVSFNLFLPVEISAGSRWAPTEEPIPFFEAMKVPFLGPLTFTAYASFQRLAGWILVPLGVAALTGLLHKRGKTHRG